MNKLSVIIPVYNEERTLNQCVKAVLKEKSVGEIIIVNDGSTDMTETILATISREHQKVTVINLPHNMGKGFAIREGFKHCKEDFIIIQDADLEYNPNEYEKLIDPIITDKADIVFGSRFAGGGPHRVLYYWHSIGNKILTHLSNMFTNLNLTDMETCYKVFKKEILKELKLEENRFGLEPELTAKLARTKKRIYEVPISYYGRTYEEGKKITWKDGLSAIRCIIKYRT
jgi:glycosyltransferase involved in cell wall biosynthesis